MCIVDNLMFIVIYSVIFEIEVVVLVLNDLVSCLISMLDNERLFIVDVVYEL